MPVARADGSEVSVELSVRPVAGSVQHLFGVCLRAAPAPASPRPAARDAAGTQDPVLRAVFDALPDPVLVVGRQGRVLFQNEARAQAHPDGALSARERNDAEAVMRTGAPVFDQEEPDPAGGVRTTTRVPVRDRAGAVVGVVAVSRDVTALRAGEAELRGAKEAAEVAARTHREVLATTSHEIRTLMSGVTGMTALLLGTDLDDEQRDFVETVRTSSNALLSVVNDVLDLSKIEAGMLEFEERPFDVRRAVKEAVDMVTPQGRDKGLALSYDLAGGTPDVVLGDPLRVQQVLMNLLSNAIKFTDEGSVEVHVEGARAADGRPGLAFTVRDTGVGIAPDRLEAVFQPFEQADPSTARTHGGTGLGLTICRRLVQMMGGEMSAESAPGGGSVFRFTIAAAPSSATPTASAHPDAPAASALTAEALGTDAPAAGDGASAEPGVPAALDVELAPAPPSGDGAPDPEPAAPSDDVPSDAPRPERAVVMSMDAILPSARVLLAEDNPVIQKVSALTLRRLGYRPDVVSNGAEAVEAVRRQPYDVVLMDVMMPGVDGLEATRQIRADPGPHAEPAVVAVTANALEGDRQKCLDAGCDDYVAKPVAPRVLAAMIERAVRLRAGAPAGAP
jgi:signal transduction histidine kinase/CheY-like chemotaxis protein